MNKVYIIIEATSVDYHGTYHEIVSVYVNKTDAVTKAQQLNENKTNCDIEYYVETFNVL